VPLGDPHRVLLGAGCAEPRVIGDGDRDGGGPTSNPVRRVRGDHCRHCWPRQRRRDRQRQDVAPDRKPCTETRDVLDSEAAQIINTEQSQAFKWELDAFNDPNTPDRSNALYLTDTANLTGALDLLQLLAQTLAPSVSLGNQALSDILYGQDQLPSTIKGPNNAFSIFNNQANGTGTQTFAQYVSQQQGRVAEVVSILDGFLASAQQTAAGTPTAVTVNPPGTQTSGLGTALNKQLSATSSARAPITKWRSRLANPGRPEHRRRRWRGQPVCASAATIEDSLDCFGRHGSERTAR